ncbi:MAG: hypothetical protein SGJ00_02490, partial [bacterium]|nr:hypothetical protein [bacterium]
MQFKDTKIFLKKFMNTSNLRITNPAAKKRSRFTFLATLLMAGLFFMLPNKSWGQVYFHNFGTTAITTKPYTGAPGTFATNL